MSNQVLSTVYLDPNIDRQLRIDAFDTRTNRNVLVNEYILLGMQAKQAGSQHLKDKKSINDLADQLETLLNTIEKLVE